MTSKDGWALSLAEYELLLLSDKTVEAIERFYADDAIVFENRALARAGRSACVLWEREQRRQLLSPPVTTVRSRGADASGQTAFFELVQRWQEPDGRSLRLEEVLVQRWHNGKIAEERHYYEGVIDESDADSRPENALS